MAERGQQGFEDDETLSGFVICDQVGYTSGELPNQRELCHSALRSLNGYIRYVRRKQQGRQEYGDQLVREERPVYIVVPELPGE